MKAISTGTASIFKNPEKQTIFGKLIFALVNVPVNMIQKSAASDMHINLHDIESMD